MDGGLVIEERFIDVRVEYVHDLIIMDHLDLFTNLLLIIPKWTALIVVIYPKNNNFY